LEGKIQPNVVDAIIFFLLFAAIIFTMSTIWRIFFAPVVGILGVITFHVLTDGGDSEPRFRFNLKLPASSAILIVLHFGMLLAWLLVPPASRLLFIDWGQISALLYARGIISLVYILLLPGILLVRILDRGRRLSRLELALLGMLFSFNIAALTAYTLFTLQIDMARYLFPSLWIMVTLGIIGNYGRKLTSSEAPTVPRPHSFPSNRVAAMFCSIVALFLMAVLSVNVTWYALVRGDLWSHIAQTALFLRGENQITYPWAYHFALASVWAVSGLPLVNALVMMQFLAVLPIFACFITLNAYARDDSRIPILGTLFYACFMGLGWISYFIVQASTPATSPGATFAAENLASYLTYDILAGILNIRLLFLPATLALASVIYSMRLLRSYGFSKPLVITAAFTMTFLSMEAHLFETVFFIAVLALSAIFVTERDHIKILAVCDLGAAAGFLAVFLIEYFSPIQQRLFSSTSGSFYFTGYTYAFDLLIGALLSVGLRLLLAFGLKRSADPLSWFYQKIERTLTKFENRIILVVCVLCTVSAIALTGYLLTHQPTYFAWIDFTTGYVPWQYYPLRIGIVALFAIFGTVILLLRLSSLRTFLEIFLFGATALTVSRGIDFLGTRPFGFGENRVMDVLWFALATLAAYGVIEMLPRISKYLGSSIQRKKVIGLAILLVIIFSGMTSFLLLVDAKILDGQYSGYALTAGDLQIAEYLLRHPDLSVSSVTSPTLQSQRKMMALTLTYPYGYFGNFYIPPVFRMQTISSFLGSVNSLSSLKIFVGPYDLASLSSGEYLPALWYLAYQPLIVGGDGSFLLSSLGVTPPSNSGLTVVDEGQPPSIGEFLVTSAVAFTQNPYSILSLNQALQSSTGTLVLTKDPTDPVTFNATYSWVQSSSRTLVVISGLSGPGLYETSLLHMQDLGVTFNASSISSLAGASFNIQLPIPLSVLSVRYQNASVIAEYSGDGATTPLAAQKSAGLGRIIFLNLRDYLTTVSLNMFTDTGRALYSFLPAVFVQQNLLLMDDYRLGGPMHYRNSGETAASGGSPTLTS
jgi:hypothetical protein